MQVRVELLGAPAAIEGGERVVLVTHRMSALLCHLAFRDDWLRRGELLALFWPETTESRARGRLRQLLLATRRRYPFAAIETEGERLRWVVESDVADLQRTEGDARRFEANRGWLMDGFHLDGAPEFDAWIARERAALHARWRSAGLRLSETLARSGRHDDALEVLERLTRRDPLDEEVARRQIALLRERDPERAARRYRTFAETLERELGARPSEATRSLLEDDRSAPAAAPPRAPKTAASPDPLPRGATAFVGREAELREAAALLRRSDCRLLTVFAPGGMGKTRFALELGRRLAPGYLGGATFVPLLHARTTEAALVALADALGVALYGARSPQRQIAEALGGERRLLILDNLEQLELARELTELLEWAPGLDVLATSRRRLEIDAEWGFDLSGLDFPPLDLGADAPPFDLDAWDATRLFVLRARQRRRDLRLDGVQRRAVARIAARVGGMPLALELAARWSDVLRPGEIDAELAARIGLERETTATATATAGDSRHVGVAAVLEQGWRRLGERERAALRRLSVAHGFTADAAREAVGVEPATLRSLIDHAFVTHAGGSSTSRFDMHPLVREYCAARAAERSDELARSRDAHARHYLRWAAERNDRVLSPEGPRIYARFVEEIDNLRAAWRRAADQGMDEVIGVALKPLEFTFRSRTWYGEWGELVRYARVRVDPTGLAHARLGMALAANALDLGAPAEARAQGEAALLRIDALASPRYARINPHPAAEVRRVLGHIALTQDRPDDAAARFEAALETLEGGRIDPYFAARLADYLGTAHAVAGDLGEGRRWLQRAVREMRALLGTRGTLAVAASNLARLELQRGEVDAALELASEALELERALGLRPRFLAEQLRSASDALRVAQRYDEAAALLREELQVIEPLPAPIRTRRGAGARDRLGQIAYLRGDAAEAERHLKGALTPRACRFALLAGDPERSAGMCDRWLGLPSPLGFLTLDLDRVADRAFVLACAAEAALAAGVAPGSAQERVLRAVRFAWARSLAPELPRAATPLAWFHAAHGDPATARQLLERVAHHPASDPETRALARSGAERFGFEIRDGEDEEGAEPFTALLERAVAAASPDTPASVFG